ncbi:MAG: OmpH family outer membrane protein [Synergistaceae bacterium]|nr:OmpH family outer membrane protein [Synergistaceae bacterium]
MKKFFTVSILATLILTSVAAISFAAGKIGYFNENMVFAASKKIPEIRDEFREKAKQKLAALQQRAANVKDQKARNQMLQQFELDLRIEEEAAIEPAIKEINLVARKVAISKGVTVLVDSQKICYGGVDITADVVKALKDESK